MSEKVWFRYGLSPDTVATVVFSERPTVEDVGTLLEFIDLQIKVLRRSAADPDRRPAATDREA